MVAPPLFKFNMHQIYFALVGIEYNPAAVFGCRWIHGVDTCLIFQRLPQFPVNG